MSHSRTHSLLSPSSSSVEQSPILRPLSSSNSSRKPYLRKSPTPSTPRTPELNIQRQSPEISYDENENSQSDQIPSVRPVVDNHDRLWAELDVLDDAAEMASQAKSNDSFFGPAHAEALEQLRSAQADLIHEMDQSEKRHDKDQYKRLWEDGDVETLRRNLFDEEQFSTISHHVANTRAQLDNVAKYMNVVDEQSKEFWQATE